MVVLMPGMRDEHDVLFENEALLTCKCGHLGLRSPIPERRSFYMTTGHCVRCHRALYDARLMATPVERVREGWREDKARQRARDPERFAERRRQAQARYRHRHRARVRQDRKIQRWKVKEQKGMSLKTREKVKSVSGASGVGYAPEPYRAWLWTIVRETQRQELGFVPGEDNVPKKGILAKVAATLEVEGRTLYRWLNEADTIDEMTLDRVCSHHGGIMPWEIYQRFANVKPPTLAELEAAANAGPVICRRPGCNNPTVVRYRFETEKVKRKSGWVEEEKVIVVRRWCAGCADELDRVREALDKDVKKFRSRIGQKGVRSTCCTPGCRQPRLANEHYCEECHSAGRREEDYHDDE